MDTSQILQAWGKILNREQPLASIAAHKLAAILPVGSILKASLKIGRIRARVRAKHRGKEVLPIFQG